MNLVYPPLRPLLLLALAVGCSDKGVPDFDQVERVITVGDNVGSNPSYSRSYIALLEANDDALFPAFVGEDFATALPDAELVRLDRGGDSYFALADSQDAIRVCEGDGTDCLDADDQRPTLVIVELGVNDLVATALAMISDPDAREDADGAIEDFQEDVRDVLAQVTDPERFERPPRVVVSNVVDPSDGVGDIADLVTSFFPISGAENVTPELALSVIAGFNTAIATEVEAIDADLVDLHGAYLGHGYHFDDEASPHHDAQDESFWYATVVDPNLRGAHEIRREFWGVLTGATIDALPGDLPLESTTGLPDVPSEGWANAVVDSDITLELVDEDDTVFGNIASDPEEALGAPTGATSGLVAVGVVGAWFVVDLGEGEAATDVEGPDLVVLEYGAQSGGTPEPYRVSVSNAADGPWNTLADAQGERAFDLADVGMSSARYVRIESLAQPSAVLGGVGSPYYPGPEIDAIGAVVPGQ